MSSSASSSASIDWKSLTESDWKKRLTAEQYAVARKRGTERAFTGRFYACKDEGVYTCICCGSELFSSKTKFDSGSGWPSFLTPVAKDAIEERTDTSHMMVRTEVLCKGCDAHLGHVFDDAPPSLGGIRYCINSVCLDLKRS